MLNEKGVVRMPLHHLMHVLAEMVVLMVLFFPLALGCAVLVGVVAETIAGYEVGLRASCVTLGLAAVLLPIAMRVFLGPNTQAICWQCIALMARPRRQEKRRHPRYPVTLPATFFNERTSGFAKVGNLSEGGCRLASKIAVFVGDVGQLLIELPGGNAPLKVAEATVRWVKGTEYGVEFIRVDEDDRERVNQFTSQVMAGS
jgi:hypothetical protein